MNVVDLVGLLVAGQRSGELVIAGQDWLASLQLDAGLVLAATAGELTGLAAVRALLDLREGEFELRHRNSAPAAAPDPATHNAVIRLLGERAEAASPAFPATLCPLDPDRCATLAAFLAEHSFARFACTLGLECVINAEAAAGTLAPREIRLLATSLCSFLNGHPRGAARRVVLEDDQGIVVGARMPNGGILMVMGDSSATTGAVAAATTRLLARFDESR